MAEVSLRISVADQTGAALETFQQRVERLGEAGHRSALGFESFSRTMARTSSAISQGVSLYAAFEIRAISMEQAQQRLTHAQRAYRDAVVEHGRGSEQATDALRQLNAAQANMEKTQIRGNFAMVASVAQVAALAAQAPAAARSLLSMAAAARTAAAGMSALQIAATGGLAAIGIIGGVLVADQVMRNYGESASAAATAVQQLRQEEERRAAVLDMPEGGAFRKPDPLGDLGKTRTILEEVTARLTGIGETAEEVTFKRMAAETVQMEEDLGNLARELGVARAAHEALSAQLAAIQPAPLDPLIVQSERIVASAQKWLDTATAFKDSFTDIGVAAQNLAPSLAFAFDKLALEMSAAGKSEEEFRKKAMENIPALKEQATVTAFKGETTEAFTERLKAMGFTEEEIKARLDETGRTMLSQEAATRRAASATRDAAAANRDFTSTLVSAGGSAFGGTARVERAGTTTKPEVTIGSMEELQLLIHQRGAASSQLQAVQSYFGSLRASDMGARFHPGTLAHQREAALKALGIPGMAEGGIVTGPTLALIGERGPEAVVPLDRAGRSVVVHITQTFHGQVDPAQVRQATQDGIRTALSPGETRLATRRTI